MLERFLHQQSSCGRWPATARHLRSGFSLIELMVTLAVSAVLITVSIPSFQSLIQRNRIASQVNSFVGDLQFARSEAIKRGLPVSLCTSSDGATCLGANTWHQGWIVFSDLDASGTLNDTDGVLRVQKGWANGDTLSGNPNLPALSFSREGFALGLPAGTVTLSARTTPINDHATRCIALNRVGRQTIHRHGSESCT
jgi:type IV fimbrial biogenesis protein FimT